MKNKLYPIVIAALALALLLSFNFKSSGSGIQPAKAAGVVGYVTIPAAAFTPYSANYAYIQIGNYIILTGTTTYAYFVAPVYLPDTVTLGKLTFYWGDRLASVDSQCQLRATDTADNGSFTDVSAQVWTTGSDGYGSSETTSFYLPTVDNSRYLYFMVCDLNRDNSPPFPKTTLYGVRIEYSYQNYLPLTIKGRQ